MNNKKLNPDKPHLQNLDSLDYIYVTDSMDLA